MSWTFALKRCLLCGILELMPPRSKRCYRCTTYGYTRSNNPFQKVGEVETEGGDDMPCDKHKNHPVKIYGECVGCEIEILRGENQHLRQQVHELYAQIEVIPAPNEWHELRKQNAAMRKALEER